mmetsp:Transcript_37745/g.59635  ORF Transcript_37745/g.59635 Transcript_37745/m.59635 type:complete len:222 (-) Transcript_37745:107-772(-)
MSSADELQTVHSHKLACHFAPKNPSSSTGGDLPSLDIFGVRPHKITERTIVRDFLCAGDGSDLIKGADIGGETTVDTENTTINNRSQSQIIKYSTTVLPNISTAILLVSLIIKPVNCGNLSRLVVPSQKSDFVWEFSLQSDQIGEGFETVVPSINKITHKHVMRVREVASSPKQLLQIIKLPMDVSTDGYRAADRLDIALFQQELHNNITQFFHVILRQAL